jgi:hypothetical protein
MNSKDFAKICQQLNIKYRDLFGEVPCPDDYIYEDQQKYIETLKKSIETNKPIGECLKKKNKKLDTDILL